MRMTAAMVSTFPEPVFDELMFFSYQTRIGGKALTRYAQPDLHFLAFVEWIM